MGYLTPAFRKFRPGGKSGLLISDYFPRDRWEFHEAGFVVRTPDKTYDIW
ncbi:MAG: hypothetical protein HYS12_04475 [Planctomycetes bacterium]|nr:hypothetical protein [Planctomycetota bacterium]